MVLHYSVMSHVRTHLNAHVECPANAYRVKDHDWSHHSLTIGIVYIVYYGA